MKECILHDFIYMMLEYAKLIYSGKNSGQWLPLGFGEGIHWGGE